MLRRRVTLRDVAKRAGYGIAATSMVLRGDKRLPESTRLAIQKAAETLGYKPDPMLSALATYRQAQRNQKDHGTIAYVTNWPTRNQWRNVDSFISFYDGAKRHALQLGYNLEEFWLREPGLSQTRASTILESRGIKGLIVAPVPGTVGHVGLRWSSFCAVALGYTLTYPALNFSVSNQARALELAWHELRHFGYRKIGLALRLTHDKRVKNSWSSGHAIQQELHKKSCPKIPGLIAKDWDKYMLQSWFLKYRPEAVISATPESRKWLEEVGAKCPDDYGLVMLNVFPFGSDQTGIYEHPDLIGEAAVSLLSVMMQTNQVGIPSPRRGMLTDPTWNPGKTIRRQS